MIFVKLIGGLGNQMFQYAAAKSLATRHAVEVKVDTLFLNQKAQGKYTQRHFELGIFEANIQIAPEMETKKILNRINNKFTRTIQRKFPYLFRYLYAVESGHHFHKEFLNYPKNTYLDGFWQSEHYFKPIESIIRNDFTFKAEVTEACEEWNKKIKNTNSVSIHVRRGDYIKLASANKFHGLCSMDYYQSGVKYIAEKSPKIELFVFSDDIEWCRQNLNFNFPIHFIETNNAHHDLFLMSQCQHNIIANSSYSWWGAWLNRYRDKIVIAPKRWFAETSVHTPDLIPDQWIRI